MIIIIKNDDGDTALMFAVQRKNNIEIVKLLLIHEQININITNNEGDTALMIAVMNNATEIVKLLSEYPEIDPNIKNNEGETVLMIRNRLFKHLKA